MDISADEKHQIENEMLYRRMNEKVGDDLGALDAAHIETNELYLIRDKDAVIDFRCECSDENCNERVPLKLSEYQEIHTQRSTFVVVPDHELDSIEVIIQSGPSYNVVQKKNKTPDPAVGAKLNVTDVDNSKV